MSITTTVIWPQDGITKNPTAEQGAALTEFANTLDCVNQEISVTNTEIVVVRYWNTQENAQAWIDYILSNYHVTSAVIDPDQ
jgi:hypothetical protein